MKRRYYCDFCKKSLGHSGAMKKHEKGCTANPGRHCGHCLCARDYQAVGVALRLLGVDLEQGEIESVNIFTEMVDGCPSCTLATLRQLKLTSKDNWSFQEALKVWWAERNEEQVDANRHLAMGS